MEIRDRSHPENPTGWDVTTVRRGASGRSGSSPRMPRSGTTWSASPRRSRRRHLPGPDGGDPATVRAFEAITRSAMSGAVERLDGPS